MKDHLNNIRALAMLLGAALGSGFLSIPYALGKFPIETSSLLLFNFASGLLSCYFLVQVCAITGLESF
jgi:amino acid permease